MKTKQRREMRRKSQNVTVLVKGNSDGEVFLLDLGVNGY